ncbi:hypothetical protein ACWCO0_10775, partial [Streptomyces tubercidicus]
MSTTVRAPAEPGHMSGAVGAPGPVRGARSGRGTPSGRPYDSTGLETDGPWGAIWRTSWTDTHCCPPPAACA